MESYNNKNCRCWKRVTIPHGLLMVRNSFLITTDENSETDHQVCAQPLGDPTAKYPYVDAFIYPMHLNLTVRKPIHKCIRGEFEWFGKYVLIEPLEYSEFQFLMVRLVLPWTAVVFRKRGSGLGNRYCDA